MEMRNLVLCVLLKFEEPIKQKIPEYGVQGEVEVGVDILEVAISTWWVFRARKLRSVQTEEESEDWARLQVAGAFSTCGCHPSPPWGAPSLESQHLQEDKKANI